MRSGGDRVTNGELTDRDEGNEAALTQAASTAGVCWEGRRRQIRVCPHTTHSL